VKNDKDKIKDKNILLFLDMNLITSKNDMKAKKFKINKNILKQKFVRKGSNILNFKNKDKK
tara:strand:+ start:221 stop:403 length:183 start_codon:yes stop_codon:yes gene_type:complete